MSITARENNELFQFDYDTAFLNAKLEEDIYVQQPEGFHVGKPNMVWKLNKALYGLKQAPREWNKTVHQLMISIGYRNLISDPCVYLKNSLTGKLILIGLYVDDSVISVHKSDVSEWESDKKKISKTYTIKDLGECHWILNIKVTRDRNNRTIILSQQAYVERIAAGHGLDATRTVSTPATPNDLFLPAPSEQTARLSAEFKVKYQSIMGELLYAANITRPDIAFVVNRLCQFMTSPQEHQLQAANRVMKYLSQTAHYTMTFGASKISPSVSKLSAYSDADYAECKQSRRSTSGCLVVYNGDIIHWFSRRQKLVVVSTTEAENIALGEAVKELLWCRSWLTEVFGENFVGAMTVYEDNQATMRLAEHSDMISQRTKHIDIRYHFLREHIASKAIELKWVESKEQLADIFTKSLQGNTFRYIRDKIICKD